ncbi:hypothetical protein ES703_23799 [subsurface metagenome]
MAAGAGVDLDGFGPGGVDTVSVHRRLLVPLDHRPGQAGGDVLDRPFQQGGFPRSRRAHQVEGENAPALEVAPVTGGHQVVGAQNIFLHLDGFGMGVAAMVVGMVVVVMVVMVVVVTVLVVSMGIAGPRLQYLNTLTVRLPTTAGFAHQFFSTSISRTRSSLPLVMLR